MDRTLIDRFERGGPALRAAIQGLTEDDLRAKPGPGAWSIRELVIHLLDSDLVAHDRMRRIAAMEKPLLIGYDENAYVAKQPYDALDLDLVCEVFECSRRLMAQHLRALPDAAFAREGVHNERGIVTLLELLEGYVWHVEHHLGFARQKRERLGKPMSP
ncbi:MAG: DinB family protein [Phycisphaeraceae bacterium]|nr:DinB family protein [Phycisphaeraceae bacterium]